MRRAPPHLDWSLLIPVESDASEMLRFIVANHSDDSAICRDPFELVAELEDEYDAPLAFVQT